MIPFKNSYTLFTELMDENTSFDDIEIHPLVVVEQKGENIVYDTCEEGEEDLWGVYIHIPEGEMECIADAKNKEDALALKKMLLIVGNMFIKES